MKTYLAGKRGICPDCGAKFVIPRAGNGLAAAATPLPAMANAAAVATTADSHEIENELAGAAEPPVARTNGATTVAPNRPPAPAAVEAESAPPRRPQRGAWYVRPPAGGQYGPATDAMLSAWIAEGRVAGDAYVWREGWADWKSARDAIDELPRSSAPAPPAAAPPVDEIQLEPAQPPVAQPTPALAVELEASAAPAMRYQARRRQLDKAQLKLALMLLAAVVVLAILLVWVLKRETAQTAEVRTAPPIQLAQSLDPTYVAGAGRAT